MAPSNQRVAAFLWENGDLVKLNSLIPPGSEINLGGAINANNRGEIVAGGTLPNGEQHAVLLMPCDDEHPDLEGCDYSLVDSADVARTDEAIASPVRSTPTGTNAVPTELRQRLPMTRRQNHFRTVAPNQ